VAKSSGGFADLVSPAVSARFYNGKSQAKISKELSGVIDGLSKALGGETIGIQSGYRSPARNAAVGGAKSSYHMKGMAADIDMSGWSTSKRQQAIETLTALGVGGFITYDKHPNMLHIDLRPTPTGVPSFMHNKTAAQLSKAPAWFQEMAAKAKPAGLAALLPDTMQAPQFREQAMAPRAPAMPGALAPYTPPASLAKAAGTPLSLNSMVAGRPEYPGSMPAAPAPSVPRGAVYAGIGAMDRALPSLGSIASSYIGGAPSRPSIGPARENPPSLSMPSNRPSDKKIRESYTYAGLTKAAAPALTPQQERLSSAHFVNGLTRSLAPAASKTQAAPRAAVDAAIDGPLGLGAGANALSASTARNVAAGTQAAQAKAYAEYEANRAKAFSAMPAPAIAPSTAKLAAQYAQYQPSLQVTPTAPPVAPPALALPPAPVLAPLLAAPKVVKDYPVAEVAAPPAPRATAYDVYNGLADTALDNTGKNTISAMPGGVTSVTNQYGATTGMTPGGYQTAVGSLPGISGPSLGKFGSAVKGAIPGVAGSALGGLLGGPVGALIGAALAKAATQPGGVLSGVNSFNTDYFGQLNAAKPQGGLGFPDRPSGGYGSGGRQGASFSNRSRNEMDSISPGASAAIGRGQGGLY
jgi:hypothetical protein